MRALVFSGGGAKGAYEVGVWKALSELNVKCDIVTGTSIGSINGALYTQNTLGKAMSLWKKINLNTVFDVDNPKDTRSLVYTYASNITKGGLEANNLRKNLEACLNIDKIYSSNIKYGLVTVSYPSMKMIELTKEDIPKDKFIDYLIASCTIYPLFKLKKIEDANYVDGGFRKSVPYELAKKMGADEFIIVNIGYKKRFKPNKNDKVTLIKPNNNIGMPVVFDKLVAEKDLKYGYNDTLKAFHKLYGKKYTFKGIYNHYKVDDVFKTFDTYIIALEHLLTILKIDDSKIYTYERINEVIKSKLKDIKKNNNIERIMYFYNNINNKNIIIDKVFKKDFLAAYYLYINKL